MSEDNDKNLLKFPSRAKIFLVAFLVLVSVSSGFVGGWIGAKSSSISTSNNKSATQQVIVNESQLISDVANEVGESVVSVNVINQGVTSNFFGPRQVYQYESAGTGIILSDDGIIVTNRHVVPKEVSEVSVTLSDGTELENVEVIGRTGESDPLDVAFLKINDKKGMTLKPAKIGESSKVIVGQKVIAIGNALGQFQNTVTSGIISGYGRSVVAGDGAQSESLQNLFQTDAAINQGNSGGPLVNVNGEVIGINTAVAGYGAENIGFAIPVDDIKGLIASVLEKGKLERPYLGVRYVSLTDDYAYEFNLDTKRGAYIVPSSPGSPSILEGSPAQKAGLKEKDIITKVNGQEINEKNSLVSALGRHAVGEEITLTIVRDGQEMQVNVVLEALEE